MNNVEHMGNSRIQYQDGFTNTSGSYTGTSSALQQTQICLTTS